MKVATTSSTGQSTRSLCQFAKKIIILIFQNLGIFWQNLKTKLIGTYTKENSSKSTFLSSKHLLMKKSLMQKYPNHILSPTRDVGWQIGYISTITCYLHLKWYFKLIKMLKGIIEIKPVSTIWWFYHYLISLPIFLIKDWMLCNTKKKSQENPNKKI